MSEPGKAMMGTAVAGGPDRAFKAAVACPLLEGIDLSGARGVLVLIAPSKQTFKRSERRNAMNTIKRCAADDAHVIFGTEYGEGLGGQLRVTVIAKGLNSARKAAMTPPMLVVQQPAHHPVRHPVHHATHHPVKQPEQQALRTGTDNLPMLNQVAQVAHGGGNRQGGGGTVQPSHEGLNTHSVWRCARSQAAAAARAKRPLKDEKLRTSGVARRAAPGRIAANSV